MYEILSLLNWLEDYCYCYWNSVRDTMCRTTPHILHLYLLQTTLVNSWFLEYNTWTYDKFLRSKEKNRPGMPVNFSFHTAAS